MQGCIQKKGKVYYAVITLGKRRKWYKGGRTRKDAQRVLNENLAELDAGTFKEIPKTSFKEFGTFWLQNYVEGNLKPSTSKSYTRIVTKNLSCFDDRTLTDITTGQLQAYVTKRLKLVTAKTVCNDIMVVKELFKHAKKWGYLKVNPAEDVDRPKMKSTTIDILTPDEFKLLLENTHHYYQTAFLTAFLTGLRAGELWALQWGDIDWNSNRLYVRRAVWYGQIVEPKSKTSIRKVDIPQQLVSELKRWKLECPISELDLVFPGQLGSFSNHVFVVNRHFYSALRRAGLRHVSFHSLRHSNASLRIQAGQNIKYISEQLGHSTIKITLDIYGHLFNDSNFTRQQVEMLDNSFTSVRKPLENPDQRTSTSTDELRNHLKLVGEKDGGGIRI